MCRLSVIIPLYNGKQYILETVKALQNLKCSKQIIIVDDGSKDDSYSFCDKAFNEASEVLLYSKANGGIADTRNFGLSIAIGEFIMFVDQDDRINVNTVEKAIQVLITQEIDAVFWSTAFEFNDGHIEPCDSIVRDQIVERNEVLESIIPDMLSRRRSSYTSYSGHIWGAIYRNSFIKSNKIVLRQFVDYEDDLIFVFDYLLEVNRVYFMHDIGYYWKTNEKSCSHQARYVPNFIEKSEVLYEYFERKYTEKTAKNLNSGILDYFRQYTLIGAVKNTCANRNGCLEDILVLQTKIKEETYKKAIGSKLPFVIDMREKLTINLVRHRLVWLAIALAKLYYVIRAL